jgi:hypothetical protein
MVLSLIDVEARQLYPLGVDQIMPVEKSTEPEKPALKRKRGRPKRCKNYEKPQLILKPLPVCFKGCRAKLSHTSHPRRNTGQPVS